MGVATLPYFFLIINTYFMNTLTDKELNDLLSLMVMVGQQPSIKAYDLLDPYYGKVSQEVWEHSHSVKAKTGLIPVLVF